jgi:riboflavin synthase
VTGYGVCRIRKPANLCAARGARADQVKFLGRRSKSGWERAPVDESDRALRDPFRSALRALSDDPRGHPGGSAVFTGIVEEFGQVRDRHAAGACERLVIASSTVLDDVTMGASIAVNGACLTVVAWGDDWWAADAVPETLRRTNLGSLEIGDRVNLERPLAAAARLGGHIVLGHVDATIPLLAERLLDPDEPETGTTELTFGLPAALAPYVVEKGSVALDGISLTVASVGRDARGRHTFDVAIIPHTRQVTTLGFRAPGDVVNFEADYLAKVVARMAEPYREAFLGDPEREG